MSKKKKKKEKIRIPTVSEFLKEYPRTHVSQKWHIDCYMTTIRDSGLHPHIIGWDHYGLGGSLELSFASAYKRWHKHTNQ